MNRLPVTLKHLRAFLAVAQTGSFTRAADAIYLTQPTVTGLIAQLEETLDTRLFGRNSRYVELTAAGRDLVSHAQRVVGDFDRLIDDARRWGTLEKGVVRVHCALSAMENLVVPAVAQFAQQYPAIRVHLQDGMYRPIVDAVLAEDVDFGITSRWVTVPGLEFSTLICDHYGALCSAEDELTRLTVPATWRDLAGRKIIDYSNNSGSHAFLTQYAEIPGNVLQPFYEVSSRDCQIALVQAALGVAILPELSAQRIATPETHFIILNTPLIKRELCLVTRKNQPLSAAAARLVAMIREVQRARLDG